jgi:hypothetical protein
LVGWLIFISEQMPGQEITLNDTSSNVATKVISTSSRPFSALRGKTGKQSSKFGTVNYSIDEMKRLNDKVRAVLPITGEDWVNVAYQFNYMRPESIPFRDVDSLKRKFKKMYCSRNASPGGRLPDYIEESKAIKHLLKEHVEKKQLGNTETVGAMIHEDVFLPEDQDQSAKSHKTSTIPTGVEVLSQEQDGKDIATLKETQEEEMEEQEEVEEELEEEEDPSENEEVESTVQSTERTRELRLKLQQLEEEYRQSKTGTVTPPHSTSSMLSVLKHSVERTSHDAISENDRVRRERKKRKMEQLLYSIHQEKHPPTNPFITGGEEIKPLEQIVQYLLRQQQENQRRLEAEQEIRRQERLEFERRLQMEEQKRQKDKQEFMLLMAAMLGKNFPNELKHYLDDNSSSHSKTKSHSHIINNNNNNSSSSSSSSR